MLGTAGGYILAVGVASVTVPIVAVVAGTAGNVVAGAISLPGQAWAGVDVVTNGAPTTGGEAAESDAALRARFTLYIQGLEKGTVAAVEAAIASVQAGLAYEVRENVAEDGSARPGHFVVIVDDGSGAPSAALKSSVYAAVDSVRPLCSTFSVQSPTVVYVDVSLTLTLSSGSKAGLVAPIESSIAAYVDSLPVGGVLSATRISAIAYAANAAIANVTGVSLNGLPGDITAAAGTVLKARSITVN